MPGLSELALAPLCFLALATCGWTLVELAAAGLGEDASLLDLLVETAKGGLERLAITNDHFRQWSLGSPALRSYETGRQRQNAGPPKRPTEVMIAAWSPPRA